MPDSPASRMLHNLQSAAQPVSQQWLQGDPSGQTVQPLQPQTPAPSTAQQLPALSDQQKLATFEAVLAEMDAEKQQSGEATQTPLLDAANEVQNEPVAYASSGVSKEQAPGIMTTELPGGMQHVESEPSPEIPAEVESFLQKVEEDTTQLPHEIVIAAEQHAAATAQRQLPQDVKVLPISASQVEIAEKKNTSYSIKWLLTFSEKLVQMFKGQTVYRPE